METHGFDPALCNNHLNPACSPLWLNAIVGACTLLHVWVAVHVRALLACAAACISSSISDTSNHWFTRTLSSHLPLPKDLCCAHVERSPAVCAPSADRGVRMFERDKNSPAILLWSLGNESGGLLVHPLAAELRWQQQHAGRCMQQQATRLGMVACSLMLHGARSRRRLMVASQATASR